MKKYTKDEQYSSDRIKAYLTDNFNILNVSGIETALNIPHRTLHRSVKDGRNIPVKHHDSLIKFLSRYGFSYNDGLIGKIGGLAIHTINKNVCIQDLASGEYFEVKELEVEIMLRKLF